MSGAIGSFVIGVSPIGGSAPTTPSFASSSASQGNTFYLEWNGDLVLIPNGSVLMASGWDEVRERIIRRFLTNSAVPLPDGSTTPPDYVFDPAYGLGAGALIDQNPTANWTAGFTSRMRQAVVADAATDPGALPSILVTTPMIGAIQVFVSISLISGNQGVFSMTFGSGSGA